MQNLIQIRRQNKEQRQQEKEEQEENTDKLNDLFVNLQKSGDLLTRKRGETNAETRDKMDAYDSLVGYFWYNMIKKVQVFWHRLYFLLNFFFVYNFM